MMDTLEQRDENDPDFPNFTYDISREGRLFSFDDDMEKYYWVPKMEIIDGKLFGDKQQRRHVLAMLLENFGIDEAVAIGDPQLWKEALEARLKQTE